MDQATVFTKTAKGITQVNQRSASLSKDLMKVLKLIDGKSNFGQIMEKADMDKMQLEKALNSLATSGYARVFQVRKEEIDPFAEDDDFDFTSPKKHPGSTQRVIAGAANDISELSRQHEKADADRRQREQAHEQARVKAKLEAETRAKLEAEARERQQAEQAAMEQARRAKEAAERARAELEAKLKEEEARKRAAAEQAARVAAEQKAKEEAEGRRLAELRAKAEREANERARAEMEAKLREEEARQRAVAEQAARAAAEQKVKEEAEQRRLDELRAKAEREAKALAEARARAEAEAAAMAKARAEAEAAAKRQAQEATNAEAALKARLKEEIEARIRQEMEELLRNEIEEKTRAQMQAQIMAEAKLAAKAELDERLNEERAALAKAELEARAQGEREARARAEEESRRRAEAEARAAAEAEARLRAEEEARQLKQQAEQMRLQNEAEARRLKQQAEEEARRLKQLADEEARRLKQQAEAEARAREEAEARAREESEARAREQATVGARIEAERRAKMEAEARAKVEAEEAERRERELSATLEAERKAKEEAEMRARIEARARETIAEDTRVKVQAELEADMTKRAEIEGKAQARAYMEAKTRAEQEEEDRVREEQSRKAREIAEILRTKVEPDDVAPESAPRAKRPKRRTSVVKPVLIGTALVILAAIALLHVVPLRPYAAKVERAMSGWLHDDVNIGSLVFRLVPSPHLRVENVAVGKLLDAKAATGRIYLDISTLFGDKLSINAVELDNVAISAEAVKRIPVWADPKGRTDAGAIDAITLRGVKLDVRPALDPFTATLTFTREGQLRTANLAGTGGWRVALKPAEKGLDFDFSARNWTLPMGAAIPVSEVQMKGNWTGNEILVPEFEADAMEGKVNGTLRMSWEKGVRLESALALARVNARDLVAAFTKDIAVTGKLDGNFAFATEGATVEQLFAAPRAQGRFKLNEGSISNVDLVAVMQSDSAGQRAGVTKFNELTGELNAADHRTSFRSIALQGGVLRGNGGVEVGNNSNLAGRLALEIRSQVAQDRGAFNVSGSVSRPIIRRGG